MLAEAAICVQPIRAAEMVRCTSGGVRRPIGTKQSTSDSIWLGGNQSGRRNVSIHFRRHCMIVGTWRSADQNWVSREHSRTLCWTALSNNQKLSNMDQSTYNVGAQVPRGVNGAFINFQLGSCSHIRSGIASTAFHFRWTSFDTYNQRHRPVLPEFSTQMMSKIRHVRNTCWTTTWKTKVWIIDIFLPAYDPVGVICWLFRQNTWW